MSGPPVRDQKLAPIQLAGSPPVTTLGVFLRMWPPPPEVIPRGSDPPYPRVRPARPDRKNGDRTRSGRAHKGSSSLAPWAGLYRFSAQPSTARARPGRVPDLPGIFPGLTGTRPGRIQVMLNRDSEPSSLAGAGQSLVTAGTSGFGEPRGPR